MPSGAQQLTLSGFIKDSDWLTRQSYRVLAYRRCTSFELAFFSVGLQWS